MKYITIQDKNEIMNKMFSYVGIPFSLKFTEEPEWYLKHTWTKEQEEDFIKWLTQYHINKLKYPKESARNSALLFNLCFGWKQQELDIG